MHIYLFKLDQRMKRMMKMKTASGMLKLKLKLKNCLNLNLRAHTLTESESVTGHTSACQMSGCCRLERVM